MSQWDELNQRIIRCTKCPRLRSYCREVGRKKRRAFQDWTYWTRPVPNFGDPRARLVVVGLAPAAHGANRTGRMFTGDRSGQWLYRALHKTGFASQPIWERPDDGLQLTDCAITAVVHCAPPANHPRPDEVENCRLWFDQTLDLAPVQVLVALGQVAWKSAVEQTVRRGWWQGRRPRFAHGAVVELAGPRWLLGSYHPSQQNTFTGRLTEPMFDRVFQQARRILDTF